MVLDSSSYDIIYGSRIFYITFLTVASGLDQFRNNSAAQPARTNARPSRPVDFVGSSSTPAEPQWSSVISWDRWDWYHQSLLLVANCLGASYGVRELS